MHSISAAMIVKDEASRLGTCLEALSQIVKEIIVVDTGSEDHTLEVARHYKAVCYEFPWQGDFAAARNYALERVTRSYVLVVDADEEILDPRDAAARLRAFAAGQPAHAVGTIDIHNITGSGAGALVHVDAVERFFKRGHFRYTGAVHEQLNSLGPPKIAAPTGVHLRHTGYAQAHDDANHKALRNIPILEREIAAQPDDEYFHFQLGKAHYSLRRYADAVRALDTALALIRFEPGAPPLGRLGPVSRSVLTDAVVTLAYALVNCGRPGDAEARLAEHTALGHPGTRRADFYHVLGYVHLTRGDLVESRAAFEQALACGPGQEDVLGTGSFSAAYHLGLLREAENDLAGALTWYLKSLQFKPDYVVTLSRCVDLITERSIVLPPEIGQVCDHFALNGVFLKKLKDCLQRSNAEHAAVLLAVAKTLTPELNTLCERLAAAFGA